MYLRTNGPTAILHLKMKISIVSDLHRLRSQTFNKKKILVKPKIHACLIQRKSHHSNIPQALIHTPTQKPVKL